MLRYNIISFFPSEDRVFNDKMSLQWVSRMRNTQLIPRRERGEGIIPLVNGQFKIKLSSVKVVSNFLNELKKVNKN